MLDGCIVGTTSELFNLLWNAPDLSRKSGMWCKSYAQCHKLASLRVLNLVSRLLIHEVPCGCARWRLGRFVLINQQNAGYISKLSYLRSWTKILQELNYIYPLFPPKLPFSLPPVLNTLPVSWTISTSCDLHNTMPLIPKHTQQPTQLCMFPLGFLPLHSTVS